MRNIEIIDSEPRPSIDVADALLDERCELTDATRFR
jgi:hypothetical protein